MLALALAAAFSLSQEPVLDVQVPPGGLERGRNTSIGWKFTNTTPKRVTIWCCGWLNRQVFVLDERGVEPPLTRGGEETREYFNRGTVADKRWFMDVDPGKTRTDFSINLFEQYELAPGKYRVKVVYHDESDKPWYRLESPWRWVIVGRGY